MKIYGLAISAPVIKTRLVANALGLDYEFRNVNMMEGEHKTEEYKKLHPAGKVPVLEDDGFVLFESGAICRYLAQKQNSDLYPKDIKQQAVVDQWSDFAAIHIGGAVGRVLFNKVLAPKMGWEVDEKSLQCGQEFLDRFLPIVDQQLSRSTYLAGDEISLADYALLAHVDPLEAIEIDVSKYSNLQKWRDAMRARGEYQKVHKFYGEEMMAQG